MRISAGALITCAALFGATVQAQSAAFVLGDNLGHSCFADAEALSGDPAAIDGCTRALSSALSPTDRASTYVNRGILKANRGDPAGALADYDAAIATAPDLAEIYVNRSATLIAFRRYGDAQEDASKALKLGAHRMEIAYYNRAIAEEQLGNIQGAYDDYRAALQAQPQFVAAAQQLTRFRRVDTNGS